MRKSVLAEAIASRMVDGLMPPLHKRLVPGEPWIESKGRVRGDGLINIEPQPSE
jgi:hypothetical protein